MGNNRWLRVKARLSVSVMVILIVFGALPITAVADTADSVAAQLTFTSITEVPINIDDVTVPEGELAVFTITLGNSPSEAVTITYSTSEDSDGTYPATTGDDYSPVSGSVTISPGETDATVVVPTLNDEIEEDDETFLVNLTDVSGPAYFEDPQGVGTILDTEGIPSIIVDDVVVQEGDPAVFTVELSHTSPDRITVEYSTEDDSAVEVEDYVGINLGTVSFMPGERRRTVTIETVEDDVGEPDEDFFLNLVDIIPAGAAYFADDRGVGTILDTSSEEVGGAGEASVCAPICPPSVPLIQGQKRDILVSDENGNGFVDNGDTIGYEIQISRADLGLENAPQGSELYSIAELVYLDPVDSRLDILENSLSTSNGEIKVEDHGSASAILVEVTDLEIGDWPISIEFSGIVTADFSESDQTISGQGIIYADNAPTALTNDPDTGLLSDPTLTPYDFETQLVRSGLRSKLSVDKKVRLLRNGPEAGITSNEPGDRIANPGDLVEFTITVTNKTATPLTGSSLLEPIDGHISYVEDSLELNNEKLPDTVPSDSTNMMSISLPQLGSGDQATVKYRGIIESPVGQNLGYLGTRSMVFADGGGRRVFSNDPETKRFGDPTVLLLSGQCERSEVSRLWDFWARFISETSPEVYPVLVYSDGEDSGISSGKWNNVAGATANQVEKSGGNKSLLNWVLYGKRRGTEALEQLTDGKLGTYRPDLAFYGAGRFSLDETALTENSQLLFSYRNDSGLAGGTASLDQYRTPFYLQQNPILPVYSRVSRSGSIYDVQGKEDLMNFCLDEAYIPILFRTEEQDIIHGIQANPIDLFIVNTEDDKPNTS